MSPYSTNQSPIPCLFLQTIPSWPLTTSQSSPPTVSQRSRPHYTSATTTRSWRLPQTGHRPPTTPPPTTMPT